MYYWVYEMCTEASERVLASRATSDCLKFRSSFSNDRVVMTAGFCATTPSNTEGDRDSAS